MLEFVFLLNNTKKLTFQTDELFNIALWQFT